MSEEHPTTPEMCEAWVYAVGDEAGFYRWLAEVREEAVEAAAVPRVTPSVEAVARRLALDPSDELWADMEFLGTAQRYRDEARSVLAVFGTQPTVAEVRRQVSGEIVEAIESKYLGPDSGRLPDGRDAPDAAQRNAYDEGLELAARIAHQASRGIGGGA